MPNPIIIKVSFTCNIPIERVEELWKKAEDLTLKQYGKSDDYRLITSIFKHSLGKECNSKLGWTTNWNKTPILESIFYLINKIKTM